MYNLKGRVSLTNARKDEWEDDAVCRQTDPDIFFDDPKENEKFAKNICIQCPVIEQCLAAALRDEQGDKARFGIFGGLNGPERRSAERRMRKNPKLTLKDIITRTRHLNSMQDRSERLAKNTHPIVKGIA